MEDAEDKVPEMVSEPGWYASAAKEIESKWPNEHTTNRAHLEGAHGMESFFSLLSA